ncbi:hypothetical protein AAC387_Pa02g3443 [Persea americana]
MAVEIPSSPAGVSSRERKGERDFNGPDAAIEDGEDYQPAHGSDGLEEHPHAEPRCLQARVPLVGVILRFLHFPFRGRETAALLTPPRRQDLTAGRE